MKPPPEIQTSYYSSFPAGSFAVRDPLRFKLGVIFRQETICGAKQGPPLVFFYLMEPKLCNVINKGMFFCLSVCLFVFFFFYFNSSWRVNDGTKIALSELIFCKANAYQLQ